MSDILTYNELDLYMRTYLSMVGISSFAAKLADSTRRGSTSIENQKLLEIAVSQLECIRNYKVLGKRGKAIFKPTNGEVTSLVNSLSVNGVIISEDFVIDGDNLNTIESIVEAINAFESSPNYSAEIIEDEIHITSNDIGDIINTYRITYTIPEEVVEVEEGEDPIPLVYTYTTTHFFGAQNGVSENYNLISEDTLERVFNNISEITGCEYAPLGTKYS